MTSIKEIANGSSVPIEIFAFGRLPLAISARCYHARSYNLAKDSCQYVCGKHNDGMDVDTVDGQPFLCVNGVQTMSYTAHIALEDAPQLASIGVSSMRLSPHDVDMVKVTEIYRTCLDGTLDIEAATAQLDDLMDGIPFSNGFLHGMEGFRARGSLEAYSMMT
jgi:collagenase-like PrtC family protease